ncbi:MAG TPA: rhodanese-like domain-containing protein [Streptosporangiaceae bacterium]|jgi:rhodanese-related sulfurtransferase
MYHENELPAVAAAEVPTQAYLVDVREDDEWSAGHVPGARHIPLGALGDQCGEIPRDRDVYVICRAGGRSARAAEALNASGWQALNVADGMLGWKSAGREMASESGEAPFVL